MKYREIEISNILIIRGIRNIFLIGFATVAFGTAFAQVTQKATEELVLLNLEAETRAFSVFIKNSIQSEGTEISSAADEKIEIDFPSYLFYVRFLDNQENKPSGRYLAVNANNANILSININVKDDQGPADLVIKR